MLKHSQRFKGNTHPFTLDDLGMRHIGHIVSYSLADKCGFVTSDRLNKHVPFDLKSVNDSGFMFPFLPGTSVIFKVRVASNGEAVAVDFKSREHFEVFAKIKFWRPDRRFGIITVLGGQELYLPERALSASGVSVAVCKKPNVWVACSYIPTRRPEGLPIVGYIKIISQK